MHNWTVSRPHLHIWVSALGALLTHMKNRSDAELAADPNGEKTDEITVHLGRSIGVALTIHWTCGLQTHQSPLLGCGVPNPTPTDRLQHVLTQYLGQISLVFNFLYIILCVVIRFHEFKLSAN